MENTELLKYELYADILFYPDASYPDSVRALQEFLDQNYPEIGKEMEDFTIFTANATLNELEELFTRTFEVQALTTLDLGYLLFGDDYKRAQLMVNLNRELIKAGIDTHNELADHLPNILRLLPKLNEPETVEELVAKVIYPSLMKMLEDFDPDKIERKNKIYKKHHKTIIETSELYKLFYKIPISSLSRMLKNDFGPAIETSLLIKDGIATRSSDFMNSIGSEMKIEKED